MKKDRIILNGRLGNEWHDGDGEYEHTTEGIK